jgi:hypothetical protein
MGNEDAQGAMLLRAQKGLCCCKALDRVCEDDHSPDTHLEGAHVVRPTRATCSKCWYFKSFVSFDNSCGVNHQN